MTYLDFRDSAVSLRCRSLILVSLFLSKYFRVLGLLVVPCSLRCASFFRFGVTGPARWLVFGTTGPARWLVFGTTGPARWLVLVPGGVVGRFRVVVVSFVVIRIIEKL